MNFRVDFLAAGAAIDYPNFSCGIGSLDKAREILGKHIDYVSLSFDVARVENPRIYLTEKHARASGLFVTKDIVRVYCKSKFLNRFCSRMPIETEDGFVWHIEFDEEECIESWAKAGYPTKWLEEVE